MKSRLYLALVLVQILFGINFVVSKIIVAQIPPTLWAFIRFLVSGTLLGIFVFFSRSEGQRLKPRDYFLLLAFAFLGFTLGQTLLLKGIQLSSVSNASLLSTTIPLFTVVFTLLAKHEHFHRNKILGLLSSFLGILVLQRVENFSLKGPSFLGDMAVLASAIGISIYIAFGKKFIERVTVLRATTLFFLFAAFELLPFLLYAPPSLEHFVFSKGLIACMLYSILGATLLTYFLSHWVLARLEATPVALFTYLQPVTAILISFFFLGETITLRTLVGAGFILIGLFLTLKRSKEGSERKPHREA